MPELNHNLAMPIELTIEVPDELAEKLKDRFEIKEDFLLGMALLTCAELYLEPMIYHTAVEASEIMGVSLSRIRQLCLAGRLKGAKNESGRGWSIPIEAIYAYEKQKPGRKVDV